jgi:hypothetical protein
MANRTVSAVGNFFDIFGSAVSASRAIEAGRRPHPRDLKALGINPDSFARIGR